MQTIAGIAGGGGGGGNRNVFRSPEICTQSESFPSTQVALKISQQFFMLN